MGQMTRVSGQLTEILSELLVALSHLDDEQDLDDEDDRYIFAKADPEWTPRSPAVVVDMPGDYTIAPTKQVELEAAGMVYFLEFSVAKEVLDTLRERRAGNLPTPEEWCEAVIYYATNDAYKS